MKALHSSLPRRPPRTSFGVLHDDPRNRRPAGGSPQQQTARAAAMELVFSDRDLKTPGMRRRIAVLKQSGRVAELAIIVLRDEERAGGQFIPADRLEPLELALKLLRDPAFRGEQETGSLALGGREVVFSAANDGRGLGRRGILLVAYRSHGGAPFGVPFALSGPELPALELAIASAKDGR